MFRLCKRHRDTGARAPDCPLTTLIACMILPFAWVLHYDELSNLMPSLLWLAMGLPSSAADDVDWELRLWAESSRCDVANHDRHRMRDTAGTVDHPIGASGWDRVYHRSDVVFHLWFIRLQRSGPHVKPRVPFAVELATLGVTCMD